MNDTFKFFVDLFLSYGLHESYAGFAARVSLILIIILLAIAAYIVSRRYFVALLNGVIKKTSVKWDDFIIEENVFERLSKIAPALVIYIGSSIVFFDSPFSQDFIRRVANAYMIFIAMIVVDAVINVGLAVYNTSVLSQQRPIKSYVQVIKIVLYLICAILIFATLMSQSAWALLSGLGAMTAVIMLVFKDSILGFVASIQIAANNMVQPGDWIEIPKYGADGDVIDITLNTVKVQNFDKTITTIPTYALISDSFKNWRGMSESTGRRIKRSIFIDMNSVNFLSEDLIERLKKIESIKDYLQEKEKDIENYNSEHKIDTSNKVNGRRLTNLGTFRAYLKHYLKSHQKIHQGMTLLVRHLAPTPNGIPIEMYVFSSDKVWSNYEDIQADIMDHVLAILPEFELRVFQNPSGMDFREMKTAV